MVCLKLDKFKLHHLQSFLLCFRRVLIILELTVLAKGADIGQRLGNPVQYTEQNANMAGGATTNGNSSAVPAPRAANNVQRKNSKTFTYHKINDINQVIVPVNMLSKSKFSCN